MDGYFDLAKKYLGHGCGCGGWGPGLCDVCILTAFMRDNLDLPHPVTGPQRRALSIKNEMVYAVGELLKEIPKSPSMSGEYVCKINMDRVHVLRDLFVALNKAKGKK